MRNSDVNQGLPVLAATVRVRLRLALNLPSLVHPFLDFLRTNMPTARAPEAEAKIATVATTVGFKTGCGLDEISQ